MKKLIKLTFILIFSLSLTACGQAKAKTKESNNQSTKTTKTIISNEEVEDSSTSQITEPSSSVSVTESTMAPVTSESTTPEVAVIKTDDEAVSFLHGQLNSSDDIEYLPWGEGEDELGLYFDFKLTSKEIRKNGGSGTVAIYRVHQNYTYELYPE